MAHVKPHEVTLFHAAEHPDEWKIAPAPVGPDWHPLPHAQRVCGCCGRRGCFVPLPHGPHLAAVQRAAQTLRELGGPA